MFKLSETAPDEALNTPEFEFRQAVDLLDAARGHNSTAYLRAVELLSAEVAEMQDDGGREVFLRVLAKIDKNWIGQVASELGFEGVAS